MRRRLAIAAVALVALIVLLTAAKLVIAWRTPSLPVLIYHNVLDARGAASAARQPDTPVLSEADFEATLSWLAAGGYHSVTLDQVVAFAEGRGRLPAKPVAITFDDGNEGIYRYAFPLLKKYRFKATVFLIAGLIRKPSRGAVVQMKDRLQPFLDWNQIREMQKSGLVDFESHTFDLHRTTPVGGGKRAPVAAVRLETPSGPESDSEFRSRLAADFARVDEIFTRELGKKPHYLAWPYGASSPEAIETARTYGYLGMFTIDFGVVRPGDDAASLPRVTLREQGAPDLARSIAEATYAPEVYRLKAYVKRVFGR